MFRFLAFPALAILAMPTLSAAAKEQPQVDFLRDIRPLIAARCQQCHSEVAQEGDLRLDSRQSILDGGSRGPALVPGKSDKSLLIAAIEHRHDDLEMPAEGEPLAKEEIQLLRTWIDQGAIMPDASSISHWAYLAPERPAIPTPLDSNWQSHPIDSFLQVKREQLGTRPLEEADPRMLLRRIYLDLVGIPPTVEQMDRFLADESPLAYEKEVDRLLASHQYGQRWGRHWMDIWRYSDWSGYQKEVRNSQPHIWHWRDWIIESLNQDRGYDQMVREMLAGDEIAPTDPDTLRATGYLVRSYYKFNRNTWLEKTVEHTGRAFLGVTIGCARCHDHIYDPISQQEYYAFRAIFEPHDIRTNQLVGQPDITKDGVPRVYDKNLDAKTFLFKRGDERFPDKEQVLQPALPSLFAHSLDIQEVDLPVEAYYPELQPFIYQALLKKKAAGIETAKDQLQEATRQRALRDKLPVPVPADPGGELVLEDPFEIRQEELWKYGQGQWEYGEGRLLQKQAGTMQRGLQSLRTVPRNFRIVMKFRILDGETYKSVGINFDQQENGHHQGVYISAHAPDPKVQVKYQTGDAISYPGEGKQSYPVKVNEDYRLDIRIRDQLVNVLINDQLALVYTLTEPRRDGAFSLWAFDAVTSFDHVRIETLPAAAQLANAMPTGKAGPTKTRGELEKQVEIASQVEQHAKLELESLEKRIAAEKARYQQPRPENFEQLARDAYKLEWTSKRAAAKLAVLQAELAEQAAIKAETANSKDEKLKKAATDATKKLADARSELEKATAQDAKDSSDYSTLGTKYPARSSGRRLALANWITNRSNPLTARVAINHIWMRHLGTPLVESVFDFGVQGKHPSHPRLLDWLAVELMEHDWSMKHIHRLVLTSRSYRMRSSSGSAASSLAADPDNLTYWRMNSRRMEAEIVRDSVLAVAGNLDDSHSGPDLAFTTGQVSHRRSVYFQHAYEKQMVFLTLFDVASVHECYRRQDSIVPQQSLALANSPLVLAQSRLLAGAISQSLVNSDQDTQEVFVGRAFERVLCRPPTTAEIATCIHFLEKQTLRLKDPTSLERFTSDVQVSIKPAEEARQRARESLLLVLFNHNEFITIR